MTLSELCELGCPCASRRRACAPTRSALGPPSSLTGSTKASRRMSTLALMSPETKLYSFSRSFTGVQVFISQIFTPELRAGVLESVKQEDENGEFKEAGELYR